MRNNALIKVISGLGLLLFSAVSSAVVTDAGKVHYLEFQEDGVTVAVKKTDLTQVKADPDNCGNDMFFVLHSTHANYKAMAGSLLTYHLVAREDIKLELSGCQGTYPKINRITTQ